MGDEEAVGVGAAQVDYGAGNTGIVVGVDADEIEELGDSVVPSTSGLRETGRRRSRVQGYACHAIYGDLRRLASHVRPLRRDLVFEVLDRGFSTEATVHVDDEDRNAAKKDAA